MNIQAANGQIELSPFLVSVIRDDAEYFAKTGFITEAELGRVEEWLSGVADPDIQQKASMWLKHDSEYTMSLRQAMLDRYWPVAPFLFVLINDLARALKEGSEQLQQ